MNINEMNINEMCFMIALCFFAMATFLSVVYMKLNCANPLLEQRLDRIEKWIDLQDYFYNYEQRAG